MPTNLLQSDLYKKYLRPEVIARLSSMELRARLVVEGFMVGLHRSPYHGFSIEFAEHRQYMPGDEIRRIDWKVYGRTNRHYIKQYEEDTNLKCYLILDSSRSMGFQSGGRISKFQYSSNLAAALAYLMVQQQDAVGLTIFDEAVRSNLSPHATKSYLFRLLAELDKTEPSNVTRTAGSLHQIAERIKRRGLIVILSDLFDQPSEVMAALKHFRHKKHEVLLFHVLDPAERSFDFSGDVIFKDLETNEEISTQPAQLKNAYRDAMSEFIETYKRGCSEMDVDYVQLDTSTPYDTALTSYLNKRRTVHG